MDFYDCLTVKEKDFSCNKIDSIEALKDFIEKQNNYQPKRKTLNFGCGKTLDSEDLFSKRKHYYIYRGIKESKFHLNTSLQLHWNEIVHFYPSISQKDYLKELVAILRQNDVIKEYERLKKNTFTEIGILALMQHYGLPTPLLDWTPDIYTALNFTYDGMTLGNDGKEISDYASLYYINLDLNYELPVSSCQNFINSATSSISDLVAGVKTPNINLDNAKLDRLFDLNVMEMDFFYVDYSEDAPSAKDIFGAYLDLTNPNLNKQDGAFIINCDEKLYLEKLWNRKIDSANEKVLSQKTEYYKGIELCIEEINNPYAKGIIPKSHINCVDIKKSVLEEWIENGCKKDLYDHSEQSDNLEKALLCEYYNWLLKGTFDKDFYLKTFVGDKTSKKQQIASECLCNKMH